MIPTLTKIHVVDQQPSRRATIAFGLSSRYSSQVYESVDELLNWAPNIGLLLLDEQTVGDKLPHIIGETAEKGAFLPVAVYDDSPLTVRIVRAMLSGAVDYLEWPFDAARLDETIDRIETEAASTMRHFERRNGAINAVAKLTDREREVLQEMVLGGGNKEIATRLAISSRTVEVHRANLLTKLNARSSADAIRFAIYAGLDLET